MLTENKWKELFTGEYKSCYKTFTSDGQLPLSDTNSAQKEEDALSNIKKIIQKPDASRPICSFFLEDLSKCWVFAYDNFYTLVRENNKNSYKILSQIEYIKIERIDDNTFSNEMKTSITYKTNSGNYDMYHLDNIPVPIIEEITYYIKRIHAIHHERELTYYTNKSQVDLSKI